jgi:hypothetical protein
VSGDDLLAWLDDEVGRQALANAAGYDRLDALREFRGLAIEYAVQSNRAALTPTALDDWLDALREQGSEEEARVRALLIRISRPLEEPSAA